MPRPNPRPPPSPRKPSRLLPARIVSGGQTGVDRGALDYALAQGIDCGGWCPRGRRAEDGRIDPRYPLDETPGARYAERTLWNVRDSDATLVILRDRLEGGTLRTVEFALQEGRPLLLIAVDRPPRADVVRRWLTDNRVRTLNVAGPRESKEPGIAAATAAVLARLLGVRARTRGGRRRA